MECSAPGAVVTDGDLERSADVPPTDNRSPSDVMRGLPRTLTTLIVLPIAGCMGTTECSCIAPSVVIFGAVSGAGAPVSVSVRLGSGVCRESSLPTSVVGTGQTETDGSYAVAVSLPGPGPECVVVSATRLDVPLVSATRHVDAVITAPPADGPQRIRVDVVLPAP